MSTYTRRFTFNAGRSRTGLVGRVRYSLDGGTTWTPAGITETVAGSGRYAATVTVTAGFQGEIDWDTNDGDMLSSTVDQTATGSGYTDGTGYALGITGGGGTGAAGTFDVVGGVVGNIAITNRGQDFTSAPTLSFPGAGSGTGAAATASLTVPRGDSEAINPGGASEYLTAPLGTPAGASIAADIATVSASLTSFYATGTVDDASPQAGTFVISRSDGGSIPDTNDFIGLWLCFSSGSNKPDKQPITGYTKLSSTTARLSFTTPFARSPANGDSFNIL